MIKPKQSSFNLVCKSSIKIKKKFRRKSKFYFSNGMLRIFKCGLVLIEPNFQSKQVIEK